MWAVWGQCSRSQSADCLLRQKTREKGESSHRSAGYSSLHSAVRSSAIGGSLDPEDVSTARNIRTPGDKFNLPCGIP